MNLGVARLVGLDRVEQLADDAGLLPGGQQPADFALDPRVVVVEGGEQGGPHLLVFGREGAVALDGGDLRQADQVEQHLDGQVATEQRD
ncbi:MAG: hypothetical protein IH884_13275, partial [Myxococcales bacterium]|nr:hypothetical protein [Myxococcales bacterium]